MICYNIIYQQIVAKIVFFLEIQAINRQKKVERHKTSVERSGSERQFQLCVEQLEGESVVRCGAILGDGGAVGGGGIAFVVAPAVVRKLRVQVAHVLVAVRFGQDRCSGNRQVFAVAFDYGLVRNVAVGFEAVAVDNEMLGAHRQRIDGAMHCQNAGVQDVNLVDFVRRHLRHRPSHRLALDDGAEHFALPLGELFTVVK